MRTPWRWLCDNTTKPVFAAVIFALGVIVWGGFNTAMEATNTLTFCVSCHEMRENAYAEYQQTKHFENHAGVRAICSDCHVPKEWGHKVVRKIKATNELFHWAMGSIDSTEKFEAKRLELARNVWSEMKENGSRECKNCHSFEAMHWKSQSMQAMTAMQTAQLRDLACIECHKGVAHQLPDFPAHYKKLTDQLNAQMQADPLHTSRATTTSFKRLYAEPSDQSPKLLDVMPLSDFDVLKRDGDWLKVRLSAWDLDGGVALYKKPGRHMEIAMLSDQGKQQATHMDQFSTPNEQQVWTKTIIEGWTQRDKLVSERRVVEDYVDEIWRTECNICHNLVEPGRYTAERWIQMINAMREKSKLPSSQMTMILKYVQAQASDMVEK